MECVVDGSIELTRNDHQLIWLESLLKQLGQLAATANTAHSSKVIHVIVISPDKQIHFFRVIVIRPPKQIDFAPE